MSHHIDIFTSDTGPQEAERRTAHLATIGENRVAVVTVSGGMMDLGWAHHLVQPATDVAKRFATAQVGFTEASARFVKEIRCTLTEKEQNSRYWCSAEFLLLELSATTYRTARLGGLRLWSWGPHFVGPVGREDVFAFPSGGPPVISTASLLPDVHWKIAEGGGWKLLDESAEADRFAAQVRYAEYDRQGLSCLAVLTHPFWPEIAETDLASLSSAQSISNSLQSQVQQAQLRRRNVLAALVRIS